MSEQRQVAIIGATFTGNRGAEAMLTTTIGRIRERFDNCRFNVYSYYPADDRRLIDDPRIYTYSATPLYLVTVLIPFSALLFFLRRLPIGLRRSLVPDSVRALGDSEVLIDLAGVSFIDGRMKPLPYNVLSLFPAFILGIPVVKFSQALGPFSNPVNRILARFTLSRCRRVFARGRQTLAHLEGLRISTVHNAVAADVAFLHEDGDSLSRESLPEIARTGREIEAERRPIIGICPSSVVAAGMKRRGVDYPGLLAGLCRYLLDQGCSVLLFPNATRQARMDRLRNNDLPVIVAVKQRLAAYPDAVRHLHVIEYDLNTDSIIAVIRECRFVIVSRFHAMIAALSARIPVAVVGWGHKYTEAMAPFGLEGFVLDFGEFNGAALNPVIQASLSDTESLSKRIESCLDPVKSSSRMQFDYLFGLMGQKRS